MPGGSSMEIHKPKPVHSWREFASEIGVVVMGIIIALSLEAAVEAFHWRYEVHEGRDRLHDEIQGDLPVYIHRKAVASCVKDKLSSTKQIIADLTAHRHVRTVSEFDSPLNGPIRHEIWTALAAAQVLNHFPNEELGKYSRFYNDISDAEYFMDRESRAWLTLHLLSGDPNQLTNQEINALRLAQREAEEMSSGVAFVSKSQVEVARTLKIEAPELGSKKPEECTPIGRGS